jgi:hypothetical protein
MLKLRDPSPRSQRPTANIDEQYVSSVELLMAHALGETPQNPQSGILLSRRRLGIDLGERALQVVSGATTDELELYLTALNLGLQTQPLCGLARTLTLDQEDDRLLERKLETQQRIAVPA